MTGPDRRFFRATNPPTPAPAETQNEIDAESLTTSLPANERR